jgi:hypothetical protein
VFDILHSIVLHLPVHLQSLDLRQEMFALSGEQILVPFSFSIRDGVAIQGWVVGVANEFNTFLEIL